MILVTSLKFNTPCWSSATKLFHPEAVLVREALTNEVWIAKRKNLAGMKSWRMS